MTMRILQRDLGDGVAVKSASIRVLAHAPGDVNVRLCAGGNCVRQTIYFIEDAERCHVLGLEDAVTRTGLARLALPMPQVLYAIASDSGADPDSREQVLATLRALPEPVTVL
jgi:hypothetical protein